MNLFPEIDVQIYFSRSEKRISGMTERAYLAMIPSRLRPPISRYKRWQDRQGTLFGKILLLKALWLQFNTAGMEKFQLLEVDRYGKPFIPGGPEFSISHSGDIVVLAVIQNGAVGIDIEEIRPINIEDFSQPLPEIANLSEKYDKNHINPHFFDCWTQKEAVLKGYGKGLLEPMEKVVLKENGTALLHETAWVIKKLFLYEGYCCHVATDRPLGRIAIEQVDLTAGNIQPV